MKKIILILGIFILSLQSTFGDTTSSQFTTQTDNGEFIITGNSGLIRDLSTYPIAGSKNAICTAEYNTTSDTGNRFNCMYILNDILYMIKKHPSNTSVLEYTIGPITDHDFKLYEFNNPQGYFEGNYTMSDGTYYGFSSSWNSLQTSSKTTLPNVSLVESIQLTDSITIPYGNPRYQTPEIFDYEFTTPGPNLGFCTYLPEVSDGMTILHPTAENTATGAIIKPFPNGVFLDYEVNTIKYTLALAEAENISNFSTGTLTDETAGFTFDSLDSPFKKGPNILIYNHDTSQTGYDISGFGVKGSGTPFKIKNASTGDYLNDGNPLAYNQSILFPPGIKEIALEFEKSTSITNNITSIIYASKQPVQSLHEYCVGDDDFIYRDGELHYITDNGVTRPATNDDFKITQDQDGKAYYDGELVPYNSSDGLTITPLNSGNIYNDKPLRDVVGDNYVIQPEIKSDFEKFTTNLTGSGVIKITSGNIASPVGQEGELCDMFNEAGDFIYSSNGQIYANLSLDNLGVPESISKVGNIALKPLNSLFNGILTAGSVFTPITQNTDGKTFCLLGVIVKYQARPIMLGHELQYKMFILDYVFLFLYYMFLFKTFYYIRHNTLISIEN